MTSRTSSPARLTRVDYDPFAGGELVATAPSSEPQREVWMASRMGPEASCAYNESFTLELRGALDVEALLGALAGLVDRHEALRTTFSPDGATLCVSSGASLAPRILDLREIPVEAQERRLAELVRREVEEPFDLERGPLARAWLVRVDDSVHHFVFTAHHIVCDGWSTMVLVRELRDLYGALRSGAEPALEPAQRFSAYALEQSTRRPDSPDEEYWLRQFEGSVPVLDLPTDEPRGAFRTYESRRYDHAVPRETVKALKALAASKRTSFFSLLFAGFTAYLHRLTGDEDVVVGVPTAGQASPGWGDLVGHCVNLLPIRTVLDAERSFTHHLGRTRSSVLDAFEHKDCTFGSLIQRLSVPRDPGRLPLVSVTFNLDRTLRDELAFPGLDVAFRSNPRHFENFEIFLNAVEDDGELILQCQYNVHLFGEATIRSRLEGYEALLKDALLDPETPVGSLPVMPPGEFHRITEEWNATTEPVPGSLTVDQLVVGQARNTPDAAAVRSVGASLTYAELDRRSERLALRLRSLGVTTGVRAAVALRRTPDLIVGLLAILRAGGTYVPLDPGFPAKRLAYILEDSGAKVLLTDASLAGGLPTSQARVVLLDAAAEERPEGPDETRRAPADPDTAAYVMYTSGSTGRPKGVQVSHRSVVNFLSSMSRQPGLRPDDVLLAVTTICFDISVLELFLPLVVGACTFVADEEDSRDPRKLADLIATSGATALQATPATWQMLVDAGWQGTPGLRALCGGEALSAELARDLVERTESAWNLYGPTETTIWSTRFRLGHEGLGRGFASIGRPIGNTRVYVLDKNLRPVPVGVPGELCIGGAGVAIGYLNRPELTEERFIPDPVSPVGEGRIYRTGDLARWTPDGLLRFEKRIDNQVKVRGFRIELGEIDTNLLEHPAVGACASLAFDGGGSDARLVSFYVSAGRIDVPGSELRSHLAERLPGYMVPQQFVRLESLPMTLNGKVDRNALRGLRPDGGATRRTSAPPETPAQKSIADAWADVLGVPQIGVDDDFFELGGHSILAVRVASRLSDSLGMEVSLRRVMATPVLSELARHLEAMQSLRDTSLPRDEAQGSLEEVAF